MKARNSKEVARDDVLFAVAIFCARPSGKKEMNITVVNKIGAFVIWLCKGRKTKLRDEIRVDTWVNWVIGYLTVYSILFAIIHF